MLEEAGVLDGKHRIRHDLGDLVDGRQGTALFTEFTQQSPFAGIHPQRELGAVVCELGDIGEVGVSHGKRHGHSQQSGQGSGDGKSDQPENGAQQPVHAFLGSLGARRWGLVGRMF